MKLKNQNGRGVTPLLTRKFDNFLKSLSDVLIDITALEVNTMVVEQITAHKFIPWEAYRDIYLISREELTRQEIDPSLHSRYLNLRKDLEMEYCLFLLEEQVSELDAVTLKEYTGVLTNSGGEIDPAETKLPNPLKPRTNPAKEIEKIQTVLDDGRFLRSLRKLSELKAVLDNRDRFLKTAITTSEPTDLICAQSIIQLDGKIINRYDRQLLGHEHQELILNIHKQGVAAGEKQWHGLLNFLVNLIESLISQRDSISGVFNRRN
jgi:hypothetical protein